MLHGATLPLDRRVSLQLLSKTTCATTAKLLITIFIMYVFAMRKVLKYGVWHEYHISFVTTEQLYSMATSIKRLLYADY
jgi:hypothetical protein